MQQFSLLMSVYSGEQPQYLKDAFMSVINSSVRPNQFVLIKDGLLTDELENVINQFKNQFDDFLEYQFIENQGLGKALQKGVELCKYNLIARFDSDDICLPHRFEWQIERFTEEPDLAILGGQIQEFSESGTESVRRVPITSDDIQEFSKTRNPFNHMTVMFRKNIVLECGNYRDVKGFEDYDLWLRIIKKGYLCENLDKVLVNARAGIEMIDRRRGIIYLKQIIKAYQGFYQDGLISRKTYLYQVSRRGFFSLLPKSFQRLLYTKLLRKE